MKTSALFLLSLLAFSACKKEEKILPKTPVTTPVVTSVKPDTTHSTPTVPAVKPDTIPDQGIFKIKLVQDSTNYDEAMFVFNHAANANFDANEDAAYFAGYGAVTLASISNDKKDLAVNKLPYKPGMSIGLDVQAKADGAYFLSISFEKNIPANIQIWVKDTYAKDSLNVSKGNYNFNVTKADTNSFGSRRFKLIIKNK